METKYSQIYSHKYTCYAQIILLNTVSKILQHVPTALFLSFISLEQRNIKKKYIQKKFLSVNECVLTQQRIRAEEPRPGRTCSLGFGGICVIYTHIPPNLYPSSSKSNDLGMKGN